VTLVAFEGGAVFDELNRRLTCGTGQNLEKFRVNRHEGIITD
jgi:hypothetical protein